MRSEQRTDWSFFPFLSSHFSQHFSRLDTGWTKHFPSYCCPNGTCLQLLFSSAWGQRNNDTTPELWCHIGQATTRSPAPHTRFAGSATAISTVVARSTNLRPIRRSIQPTLGREHLSLLSQSASCDETLDNFFTQQSPRLNAAKYFKALVVFLIAHITNRQICETNCLRYQPPFSTFHYDKFVPSTTTRRSLQPHEPSFSLDWGEPLTALLTCISPLQGLHTIFSLDSMSCLPRLEFLLLVYVISAVRKTFTNLSSSLVQNGTHSCSFHGKHHNSRHRCVIDVNFLKESATFSRLITCLLFSALCWVQTKICGATLAHLG